MSRFDRQIRRLVPSLAKLSYNPIFKVIVNAGSSIGNLLFPEYQRLPPTHLRVRVGVANRLFFNQSLYIELGERFWINQLLSGDCDLESSIVEVGCGCGRMARPIYESSNFRGAYTGIDIDDEMLHWCRENLKKPNFQFLRSTNLSHTYSKGSINEGERVNNSI